MAESHLYAKERIEIAARSSGEVRQSHEKDELRMLLETVGKLKQNATNYASVNTSTIALHLRMYILIMVHEIFSQSRISPKALMAARVTLKSLTCKSTMLF